MNLTDSTAGQTSLSSGVFSKISHAQEFVLFLTIGLGAVLAEGPTAALHISVGGVNSLEE